MKSIRRRYGLSIASINIILVVLTVLSHHGQELKDLTIANGVLILSVYMNMSNDYPDIYTVTLIIVAAFHVLYYFTYVYIVGEVEILVLFTVMCINISVLHLSSCQLCIVKPSTQDIDYLNKAMAMLYVQQPSQIRKLFVVAQPVMALHCAFDKRVDVTVLAPLIFSCLSVVIICLYNTCTSQSHQKLIYPFEAFNYLNSTDRLVKYYVLTAYFVVEMILQLYALMKIVESY